MGGQAWMTKMNTTWTRWPAKTYTMGTALQAMLQKLLADRFQLTLHREQRELSVYSLAVRRAGPS